MIRARRQTSRSHHDSWCGRLLARVRRDDGSGALEIVVVAPVVIAAIFLSIQVALYSYARSIAMSAAQQGATAERAYNAPAGAGQDKAAGFVARNGDSLHDTRISVQRGADTVRVTVTGRSLSVIPGFGGFTVSQTAAGPVERFTQ